MRPDAFKLFGRIHQVGAADFAVVVAAVPEDAANSDADVELCTAPDRAAALERVAQLAKEVGQRITARGDRVIDVLVDDL